MQRAKPSPGHSRPGTGNLHQPTGYRASRRVRRGRASSASAFPATVPIEARWQQGHTVSLGAQGEPQSRQGYGMITGLPHVRVSPCLACSSSLPASALNSSRSESKQFPWGWGRHSFVGLALGAKILLSQGRFLLSELLSLPGGFICQLSRHRPAAPSCRLVPRSRQTGRNPSKSGWRWAGRGCHT